MKSLHPWIAASFGIAACIATPAFAQSADDEVAGPAVKMLDETESDMARDDWNDDEVGDAFLEEYAPQYEGGRGLITMQGMSGMFQNPTSGTLPQGALTVQWCILVLESDHPAAEYGNGVMAAYGVTDWLEVGAFGDYIVTNSAAKSAGVGDIGAGGPFVRARLIKDEEWMPEVSIGGIIRDGSDRGDGTAETFIAASKYFAIDEEGVLKGVRLHGGFRYKWVEINRNLSSNYSAPIFYGGGEVSLPYALSFIAEVGSKYKPEPLNDMAVGDTVPWAFGMQWKPNSVVGVSVAGVQNQASDAGDLSFYFGIGLAMQF